MARIKIINKNNDTWYNVVEGSVLTKRKNETLDSAIIKVSNIQTPIDISILDLVEYETSLGSTLMKVDEYQESMVSVVPVIYEYSIQLVSMIKELEGEILPNLSITNTSGHNYSVKHYIEQYLEEYSPKMRILADETEKTLTYAGQYTCPAKSGNASFSQKYAYSNLKSCIVSYSSSSEVPERLVTIGNYSYINKELKIPVSWTYEYTKSEITKSVTGTEKNVELTQAVNNKTITLEDEELSKYTWNLDSSKVIAIDDEGSTIDTITISNVGLNKNILSYTASQKQTIDGILTATLNVSRGETEEKTKEITGSEDYTLSSLSESHTTTIDDEDLTKYTWELDSSSLEYNVGGVKQEEVSFLSPSLNGNKLSYTMKYDFSKTGSVDYEFDFERTETETITKTVSATDSNVVIDSQYQTRQITIQDSELLDYDWEIKRKVIQFITDSGEVKSEIVFDNIELNNADLTYRAVYDAQPEDYDLISNETVVGTGIPLDYIVKSEPSYTETTEMWDGESWVKGTFDFYTLGSFDISGFIGREPEEINVYIQNAEGESYPNVSVDNIIWDSTNGQISFDVINEDGQEHTDAFIYIEARFFPEISGHVSITLNLERQEEKKILKTINGSQDNVTISSSYVVKSIVLTDSELADYDWTLKSSTMKFKVGEEYDTKATFSNINYLNQVINYRLDYNLALEGTINYSIVVKRSEGSTEKKTIQKSWNVTAGGETEIVETIEGEELEDYDWTLDSYVVKFDSDLVSVSNVRLSGKNFYCTLSYAPISTCNIHYSLELSREVKVISYDPTGKKIVITAVLTFGVASGLWNLVQKFTLGSTSLLDRQCPEMQWNTPTLREVITDLMLACDCVPTITYNNKFEVTPMDLTEVGDSIEGKGVNYITRSQSSSDYESELYMNLQNIMGGDDSIVTTTEWIPFTTSDYLVTSDNLKLETKYPILRLKHLYMVLLEGDLGTVATPNLNQKFHKVDLCNMNGFNFVREYEEYVTIPILQKIGSVASYPTDDDYSIYEYQNFLLNYTRYGTEIGNFSDLNKETFLGNKTLKLQHFMALILKKARISTLPDENLYFTALFEVEYETTKNCVFRASKDGKGNRKHIIDNQTNSNVSSYAQGNLEYQKANRLGNHAIQINARQKPTDELIKIGDYVDYQDERYILYQVEYQFYKSNVGITALACPNYILKNYYTGVDSKVRTWKNATTEAFERHDLVKYYCDFSYSSKDTQFDNGGLDILTSLCSSLKTYVLGQVKNCLVTTEDSTGRIYPSSDKARLDIVTRAVGRSVVVDVGFEDNYYLSKVVDEVITEDNVKLTVHTETTSEGSDEIIGYYPPRIVDSDDFKTSDYGGIPLNPMAYVDDNGEINETTINLYNGRVKQGSSAGELEDVSLVEGTEITPIQAKNFYYYSLRRPLVRDCEDEIFTQTIAHKKDNREIPSYSLQFEFNGEKNIFVGNGYAEFNQMASRTWNRCFIYTCFKNAYDFTNDKLPSSAVNLGESNPTITKVRDGTAKIVWNISNEKNKVVLLVRDGKIILAFLDDGTHTIYLNIFAETDDLDIYDQDYLTKKGTL